MKKKLLLIVLGIVCLLIPHYAGAIPLVEQVELVYAQGQEVFDFDADQTPLEYGVWLTDYNFPALMKSLAVTITTNTDFIAQLLAPGMTSFSAVLGTTYFATVFYEPADTFDYGMFGLLIEPIETTPIPEPATMFLLGTGLIGLAGLRRKFKK